MEVFILTMISCTLVFVLLGWVIIGLAPVFLPITGVILHLCKSIPRMESCHKAQETIYVQELRLQSSLVPS